MAIKGYNKCVSQCHRIKRSLLKEGLTKKRIVLVLSASFGVWISADFTKARSPIFHILVKYFKLSQKLRLLFW